MIIGGSLPHRDSPLLPAHARITYSITSPLSTHYRKAACAEVECDAWQNGWLSTIDLNGRWPAPDGNGYITGEMQANYIRTYSGRTFTEERTGDGLVTFRFHPGQEGFGHDHQVPLDRPEFYLRRGGDHRGNPRGERYQHSRPALWVEDFSEHIDHLNRVRQKG